MKLCSACLLGVNCRYNNIPKANEKVLKLRESEVLIPVCPEQLGGLATPRDPAEIRGEKVVTSTGSDKTADYKKGAEEVLKIAKLYGVNGAILKQGSPSCGNGRIYDGTFTGTKIVGDGITTRLLKENGIIVISEDDL